MISSIAPAARRVFAAAALGLMAAFAAGCTSGGGAAAPAGSSPTTPAAPTSPGGTAPVKPAVSPAASTAPGGPPECTTSDLRVSIGHPNGAAGTIYYDVEFTNISSNPCFVRGYPGVSLVSAPSNAGSQIGADAKRTARYPSQPFTLSPGQTANSKLGVAEAGNFPASTCNPVTAPYLKVFPPDQSVAAYLHFTTRTCASTSQPTMTITTVVSGP